MTKPPSHPKPRARKAKGKYTADDIEKAHRSAFRVGVDAGLANARAVERMRRGREMVWEDLEQPVLLEWWPFDPAILTPPPSLWERVRGALRLIKPKPVISN